MCGISIFSPSGTFMCLKSEYTFTRGTGSPLVVCAVAIMGSPNLTIGGAYITYYNGSDNVMICKLMLNSPTAIYCKQSDLCMVFH